MAEEVPVSHMKALCVLGLSLALWPTFLYAETTLPCRQPQVAAAGSEVYVACGTADAILVARSSNGGHDFAAPITVATVTGLALGGHRGPRVVIAGDALVVTAVVGKPGVTGGGSGDLVAWRSLDTGLTWTGPMVINDVPDAAREGLHAMASRGRTIAVAWLDLRAKGTRLYMAVSNDAGVTWGTDELAYQSPTGTICQCCHPSLAVADDRAIVVMFRNEQNGLRDMYVTRRQAGHFTPAQKVGSGSWALAACPMDGGGVVVDDRGVITTTWRRDQTVYLAQPGKSEKAVGTGVNPAIALGPGGPYVAWNAAEGLSLRGPGDRKPMVIDAQGKFASLATGAGSVIVAYESGSSSVVGVVTPN